MGGSSQYVSVLGPRTTSTADPPSVSGMFTGTGPNAAAMAELEKKGNEKPVGPKSES